ncbi:flagellar basal body P-ring formation protein FlgA [Rheinheimera riviphila]|uniref:Flagella basal body P-ring formation protein FlgA n=1 Tax=Rheinheimera riviphila TaxID=1834037 RepID=A0A437QJ18_9GAMM|nr:flagellar basal body P-ring formation chaperone FlgA [Rheinheimera riviphila]RVU34542.1 flagellar basal body P-ring formation protein FlgA [Rheinheimera riviphila]
MKMYDKFLPKICHLQALCAGLSLLSWGVSATSYSMLDLTTHTTNWLEQQVPDQSVNKLKIQVYPLDSRLSDKNCEQSLQMSLVNVQLQRQNTVRIQCPDTGGWQLFVSAKVSQLVNAVAVTRQLAAGSYLSNDLLVQTETELLQSRGALVNDAQFIVGARTKKALNPGQIITKNDLCLVCKGDVVTIAGVSNGLSVTTQATALQDGTFGDDVKVQNLQSKRVVTAQITAVKRVEIKL